MSREKRSLSSLDLGFVLALVIPLVALDVHLKLIRIGKLEQALSGLMLLDLFKSDLFFYLAFLALGLALIGLLQNTRLRIAVFIGMQLLAVFISLIEIAAHNYYMSTGAYLTYNLLFYSLMNFQQVRVVMASEAKASSQFLLIAMPALLVVLPWLVSNLVEKVRQRKPLVRYLEYSPRIRFFLLGFFACSSVALSMPSFSSDNTLFSQNYVYNVIETFMDDVLLQDDEPTDKWQPPSDAILKQKAFAKQRNLVFIILESVRASATSIYADSKWPTTPYLKELASRSLVAERAFSVIPHTSKCLVAIHCGIEPNPAMPIKESHQHGMPAKCLPTLLNEQGYRTVYFQSPWKWFENRTGMVKNLGHGEFYPGESMSTEGFDKVNYFGHEDRMMIKPSKKWLQKHQAKHPGKPFMVTYLTGGSHHYYGLPKRYKRQRYDKRSRFNRYLNTIRIADDFVKELIAQYKDLGVYEETIFVILGDHGEGFGEHGVTGHSFVPYSEGLQIPLVIHDPRRFKQGFTVRHAVQQHDLLPTLAELMGFDIENNRYRGQNMLQPVAERAFYSSCWHENECLVRFDNEYKYIHHFNKRPDEAFHVAQDPYEKKDIIKQFQQREIWRKDALRWYRNMKYFYKDYSRQARRQKKRKQAT